jgi:hypothetical protein
MGPAILIGLVLLALGTGGGYLASRDGGPLSTGRLDTITTEQRALNDQLTGVASRVEALDGRLVDLAPASELAGLQTRLDAAETGLAEAKANAERLTAEIEELRRRPAEVDGDKLSEEAVAAYERELAAMREMFQAELDRVRADSTKAVQAAMEATRAGASAEALAALSDINTALDTGAAFGPALDRLEALDAGLPVGPLRPHAQGVETLATLQGAFPAAARAALNADTEASAPSGMAGFLKAQLGMRSLSPKGGDDADAILSRAEAALRGGSLMKAVAELDALGPEATDALSAWRARADIRLEAMSAFAELARKVQG